MIWPPDYAAEYVRRQRVLIKLTNDKQLRALCQVHYASSAQGCVDWINDWAITFDPRKPAGEPNLMPFILFPKQVDMVHYLYGLLHDKESGLIEKARDMGASWVCVAFSAWLWLYHDGIAIGWGSRKAEYVDDKGDPKAIFPKIRQLLSMLPGWMLPRGYSEKVHAPYMKIINPVNGSTITGESGDSIGRGGRTTMYFKDESAHYERPKLIEAALGDNTDVQVDISSVNGTGNVFYQRRMNGEVWGRDTIPTRGKVRVFILEWRDHPGKTQEWYDLRRQKAIDEGLEAEFAQEVDRDYSGAVHGVIIPAKWLEACVDAHIRLGIRMDGESVAAQDIADEGGDKNALAARKGIVLVHAHYHGGDPSDAAHSAVEYCVTNGVHQLYYDSVGVGAGFKTETNTMRRNGGVPNSLKIMPWNGGASVLQPEEHIIPGDEQSPTNEDYFENLKAQSWIRLKIRVFKTWQCVTQ